MALILFALLVLVGTILYLMNPDERKALGEAALARLKDLIREVRTRQQAPKAPLDPLHEMLLARTKWPIVALLLIGACLFVWMATLFDSGPALQWQIAWGASYAPRTTNGEWWRLVTYTFVPTGFFHLLVTIAALLSLGVVLERLVGSIAFAAVYLASAIVASVAALWLKPATSTAIGAAGAVYGLYGLLIAALVYAYLRKPRLPWSAIAAKRLAAGAVPFLLFNLPTGGVEAVSELAGLGTGLLMGLSLARRNTKRKPRVQRAILVPAVVAAMALVIATPLRGTIDARPEIARIAEVENRTALEYAQAVHEFTEGRRPPKTLVQLIDKSILPALEADRARVEGLRGVPREQKPLVEAARDYFKLRERSWRKRQAGLTASSVKILKEADQTEREALGAFDRIQRILGTTQTAVLGLTPEASSGPRVASSTPPVGASG